jgi:RimJ/RimL family protein N-acetyltransferase
MTHHIEYNPDNITFREFIEPGITSCIVDPEPSNKIAIRAYEKASFSYSHTAWNAKYSVEAYILTINRESVYQPPAVL